MPKVVVFSPYYNRGHVVERTVLSIENQTYTDFEAYFVDDGSTDDTYAQLLRLSSQRVHARTQPNKGFTRTIIDTINETDSEFIAIQGSGDVSLPSRLEKQVALLSENPDVVLVGCHRQQLSEIDGRTDHHSASSREGPPCAVDLREPLFSGGGYLSPISLREGGWLPVLLYIQARPGPMAATLCVWTLRHRSGSAVQGLYLARVRFS